MLADAADWAIFFAIVTPLIAVLTVLLALFGLGGLIWAGCKLASGGEEETPKHGDPYESLVPDPRSGLTPAQLVDQRLIALLEKSGKQVPPHLIQRAGTRTRDR